MNFYKFGLSLFRIVVLTLLFCLSTMAQPNHVEDGISNEGVDAYVQSDGSVALSDWDKFWYFLWGVTPDSGLLFGLWSWHYGRADPFGPDTNWQQNMVGVNYESFFLGTFTNTYYQQSFSVGLRRFLWVEDWDNGVRMDVGYNVGLIFWGYHNGEGFFTSNYAPIVPIVQVFYDITWHGFGVELGYIPGLFTAGFIVQF
jgi:hypothetical protein